MEKRFCAHRFGVLCSRQCSTWCSNNHSFLGYHRRRCCSRHHVRRKIYRSPCNRLRLLKFHSVWKFKFILSRNHETFQTLAEYTVKHHFPEHNLDNDEASHQLVESVSEETALMIAHWMRVGFVHGVMNTDNMSIHGLTVIIARMDG